VSYLHSFGTDRLAAFSNLGTWTPTRAEWAAYLAWSAERLSDYVRWSTSILAAHAVPAIGSDVELLKLTWFVVITSVIFIYRD
jgi:L-ornithine N5-monooxygenase